MRPQGTYAKVFFTEQKIINPYEDRKQHGRERSDKVAGTCHVLAALQDRKKNDSSHDIVVRFSSI